MSAGNFCWLRSQIQNFTGFQVVFQHSFRRVGYNTVWDRQTCALCACSSCVITLQCKLHMKLHKLPVLPRAWQPFSCTCEHPAWGWHCCSSRGGTGAWGRAVPWFCSPRLPLHTTEPVTPKFLCQCQPSLTSQCSGNVTQCSVLHKSSASLSTTWNSFEALWSKLCPPELLWLPITNQDTFSSSLGGEQRNPFFLRPLDHIFHDVLAMLRELSRINFPAQGLQPCPRAGITCTPRLIPEARQQDVLEELSSTLQSLHPHHCEHHHLLHPRLSSINSVAQKIQRDVTGLWHRAEASSCPGTASEQNCHPMKTHLSLFTVKEVHKSQPAVPWHCSSGKASWMRNMNTANPL